MTHQTYSPGQELHGFSVQRTVPLPDLAATLVELEHGRTGARWLHLANGDDNNLFGVGFRTPPPDSTGVAHILEHTALCGSRRYPVRDPFFAMLRRSLSTFMNAMTADDWTLYPFATQNRADFYNLLGVYLDATFFPLLRERDFRQEGHRLEFEEPADPSTPLVIRGIVYNEMKGHMTDPHSLLAARVNEALYPTTPYGRNAGGEPRHIPELTWEALRRFHAACYHPSNAYFFTYGDLPLAPHLAFAQEHALREFERREVDTAVGLETRFAAPRRAEAAYPVDPAEPLEGKTSVEVAWLTCPITDPQERLGLEILAELLLGNPAAPLYKALLDSKLGTQLAPGTGYGDENRETAFAAGLQGTEPDRAVAIEALILGTLEELARTGFPADRVEAAIHQLEFSHREVKGDHYPYGLGLLSRLMGPWIHGADPAQALELSEGLAEIRRRLAAGGYLAGLIRRWLLDNPHRVTVTLRPDPELGERQEAEEAERLARQRGALDDGAAQALVTQAQALAEAQEAQEDLSLLPGLEVADIPRQERPVAYDEADGVRWFDQPTNGIGYFHAHLDLGGVPAELDPYLPLFCAALPMMGAAGQPYTVLAERITAATGGLRAGLQLLEDPARTGAFAALADVEAKALGRNQGAMFEILRDLFTAPD
ncbi:MAG: insulinase family protein, partial [Deferrisomatales bacterium]